MSTTEPTPWIKATASNGGNNCVEMRRNGLDIQVRDSKDPDGPVLNFTPAEVAAWVDGASKGEFNQLYTF
jgi:hypothetical protein